MSYDVGTGRIPRRAGALVEHPFRLAVQRFVDCGPRTADGPRREGPVRSLVAS
jgi:hypothetical protein